MTLRGEVLLVDDVPENLRVLAGILEREGLKVRLAGDGQHALRSAGLRRPDVVLLDVRMPVLDGFETCRRLRADPSLADIPVIFLSASDEPNDRLMGFQVGGVDFIAKPFNADEVLARVSVHLELAQLREDLAQANQRLASKVRQEFAARQVAEDVAQESAERLSLALAAAGMGCWQADAATGTLVFDSRSRTILGLAQQVPEGIERLIEGFAAADRSPIANAWRNAASSNGPLVIEGWWQLLPSRRRIRMRGEPLSGDGSQIVGLVWDVTAEHDLRERLAQGEKMECLGRMAGGVAHDFNNHLAVLLSTIDMLRLRHAQDPQLMETLTCLERSGDHAAALVRDLLFFARRREIGLEAVDLRDLLERSAALVTTLVGRHIRVELRLGNDVLPVQANAGQLQNALLNLCANARDAMPQGGTLIISTHLSDTTDERCRLCSERFQERHVVLSVSDTGEGIAEALQDRIFEPFFTTKPEGKGTGIGLAAVAGCVAAHHGHLSLHSSPGAGACFRIHLPLRAAACSSQP